MTSSFVHAAVILASFLIAIPVLQQPKEPSVETAVLIAPKPPDYLPRVVTPPHHTEVQKSPLIARTKIPPPKPLRTIKPIEIKPVQAPKPQLMAAAPEIKSVTPEPTVQPTIEPKLAPAPKPAVRTGTFQTTELAKGPQAPKPAKVGGFGDPNGVPASANSRPSPVMMARIGSFDLPEGGGHAGGGGRSASGGVRQTAFGSSGEAGGGSGTSHAGGTVKTGAFGETPIASAQTAPTARQHTAEAAFTPVEILSKPKPIYSQEARELKLEGQVSLDVVFLSSGSIKILRVVHGLGHGLDEAAQQAAQRVRFRPATRGGMPVDTNATIYITFELT